MATITQPDIIERLLPLFEEAQSHAVVVSDGQRDLGAVVSMEDYEIVLRAKNDDLFAAMEALGNEIRENAAREGISLEALEKMLDRKAP